MKLPKNYFEDLSAAKYQEYLSLLPRIEKENTKSLVTLILTFAALTFFGIFAINPTLTTIVDLKKQLKDSEFVASELQKKIVNLSTLQQKYNALTPEFPIVYDAIPQNPSAFLLAGQIQALAKKSDVSISTFRVFEVRLAGAGISSAQNPSFGFSMQASGQYEKMLLFASSLSSFNRIIAFDSVSMNRDVKSNKLVLEVQARGYFKQ